MASRLSDRIKGACRRASRILDGELHIADGTWNVFLQFALQAGLDRGTGWREPATTLEPHPAVASVLIPEPGGDAASSGIMSRPYRFL